MKTSIKTLGLAAALLLLPGIASAASIIVSPASQTIKVGDSFSVSVKLDTQGNSIDGVDIRYLTYNPSLLQVVDEDPATKGVQINPQTLMPITVLNSVDNALGRIAFSQVVAGGTKYKGSGTLAIIKFKAIAPGNATLNFSYTPKNTTDTNIAAHGVDILDSVTNGAYIITGTASQRPPVINRPPQGTAVTPDQTQNTTNIAPPTGDTNFQFSQKKSFWQIIVSMISDSWHGFTSRVAHIFGK